MLRLIELTKEYDDSGNGGRSVLAADHLNLEIPAGEIFGLVGPNGAGKTTTLKMVCGLLVPTAGRVAVNNVDVERNPEEAQRFIGYLADFFSLYDDLKVWEYLDYFAHAYKLDDAMIPARITEVILRLGLETKRDSFVAGLSRGMKQRLGIARAIVHDPPLLVLDEPAAGLDPKSRHELKQLLRGFNARGKTILVTSHVLSDLEEICTSIAILEKGRLIRAGKLEEVMQSAPPTPGGERGKRSVRVRLAVPGFALDQWLAGQPLVSRVSAARLWTQFEFAGSDAELAELVKALVNAGAAVASVEMLGQTLEDAYSRIAKGEVT